MNDQELESFQELRLSAAANHHPSAAVAPKRHSPSSPFQERTPKRAALLPPSSPSTTTTAAAAAADYSQLGFTKLPLPPLRRTLSEPIHSPTSPGLVLNMQPLQEISLETNTTVADQESFPFPKTASLLYRTVSDPHPVVNQQPVAATGTPPRPPVRGIASTSSPSCGDSPSLKRLKRMRERLKEMNQWWNDVISEDDEDEEDREAEIPKEEESEIPSQEAVWIEKIGECLALHFKCPCGKGYQILLCGKNCYYKLADL